ncbi:MAG TPA: aldo/keto reductase [Chthoniobacteraceae bacterium]|nr:aldo/keto reductase [Chthoniobacteraceae bacterium]
MQPTLTAYGTWSGGRFMHYGEKLDETRFIASIRRAYERGIRTFMTADVYGNGESDTLLGQALHGLPRDSYCLIGAVGHDFYKGERQGSKGFPRFTSPALRESGEYASYLRTATQRSLERIGADRFDLVLLHNPDQTGYRSPVVWDGMAALREEGLTAQLGIAPGPANGFTLDLIGAFEDFGDRIDWAMIILNPFEPWPGGLCLKAAEKHGVRIITRVVDYGGIFHDDVKPGHAFGATDHRVYRPAGWVEAGNEKLEKLRPYAERHGLTMLQLACAWDLAHPAVQCVIPTLIQEVGEGAKSIDEKIDDLAVVETFTAPKLTPQEVAEIGAIGNNKGCMALKGGNTQYEGEAITDQWPTDEKLREIAQRWGISPGDDLVRLPGH